MESYYNNPAIQSLLDSAKPLITGSIILTAIIVVVYIISTIMKVRSQKAILDIRKTLKEMNERQKDALIATPPPVRSINIDENQKTNLG